MNKILFVNFFTNLQKTLFLSRKRRVSIKKIDTRLNVLYQIDVFYRYFFILLQGFHLRF
jgi:hypothetical protein